MVNFFCSIFGHLQQQENFGQSRIIFCQMLNQPVSPNLCHTGHKRQGKAGKLVVPTSEDLSSNPSHSL